MAGSSDASSPTPEGSYEFVNEVKGGRIPSEFIPSCDKGFRAGLKKGELIGFPVIGVRVVHERRPSTRWTPRTTPSRRRPSAPSAQVYRKAKPQILEPIMKVSVEGPTEYCRQRLRHHQPAPRHHRQLGRGRRLHPGRRRGPAERDVRLLDRPALADPGQGRVHHGVPQVRPGARRGSPRSSSAEHAPGKRGNGPDRQGDSADGQSRADQAQPAAGPRKAIHGGLGTGNIGVLASPKGVGKTACLVHIATDKLFQGKPVIHVSYSSRVDYIITWYEDIFKEIAKNRKLTTPWTSTTRSSRTGSS